MIVGVVGVVLDGGAAYAMRRQEQSVGDLSAMAGATAFLNTPGLWPAKNAAAEAAAFLSTTDASKRSQTIERLLATDDFGRTWGHLLAERERPKGEFWSDAIAALPADFIWMAEVYWDMEAELQSLGFTYTVLVASEIVAATAGVGWMIWDASKFLLSDVVIMGLFVLGLTGLALDWCIRQLERLITPWRFA